MCNMKGCGVVGDCHRMDGGGVVEGGCMVGNCMVGVRMSHNRRWDNVSVLVQDGFGQVGIEEGVSVEAVEGDGRAAVNCVPELAPEQVLIEECAVGADEARSLRSVPSVVANAIRLTSRLRVSVHAGGEGDAGAAELSVGWVSMAGVVHAGVANCAMLVVLRLVVGLGLMVGSRGVIVCRCHHRGVISWRCWFMVGWRRRGIWCRLMIGWWRRGIWCRFMVGWGRWGIRCRLMIGWWRRGIWCRFMV